MRVCYVDCTAGVSGDMVLGAALDLGVSLETLVEKLQGLGAGGFEIQSQRVRRCGVRATQAVVRIPGEDRRHRGLSHILQLVEESPLSATVKARASGVFRSLVQVEAGIHAVPEDEVHLHEVGAMDAIIDVVGAMIAFEELGIDRFHASALRLGQGRVQAAHGELPVPAPATLELLKGKPVFGGAFEGEFTTPTGAAIVCGLCETFGPMPPLRPERIGYGAGSRDPEGLPNVLRLVLGEEECESRGAMLESVEQLEATLDDMNPELFGHLFETLFEAGALEVYLCPVQTKKTRPGVLLSVLVRPDKAAEVQTKIFEETTTLGIRTRRVEREILERRHVRLKTPYGEVGVKEGLRGGRVINYGPEYEDCRRLALEQGVPLKTIFASAVAAYLSRR